MDLKISFFIGLLLMLLVTFADWAAPCPSGMYGYCRCKLQNQWQLSSPSPSQTPVPTHYQVKQSPHKRKKEGFGFVPLKLLLLALYLLEHFHGMVVQSQGWGGDGPCDFSVQKPLFYFLGDFVQLDNIHLCNVNVMHILTQISRLNNWFKVDI